MLRFRRWFIFCLIAFVTLSLAIACSGKFPGTTTKIRIGSKDFTEQFILAEMYALILEDNGFVVERKLNLGGTPIAQESLTSGEIDLYPEYTGTALLSVLKLPSNSDRQKVYETVAIGYKEQFNLIWLLPSPMNNTQALVLTQESAEKYGIETLSDLVANADRIVLIGPPEFQEREDGLPGLEEVYGKFTLKEYRAVDASLRYQGLTAGEADVAVGFGTDGEISAYNLVLLEDDKNLFPPYQVAPVVRQELLDRHPEIEEILNNATTRLTDSTMQKLNYEVTGKQREPADVANEFLQEEGLLKY
ncbi:MAG: glycine betaine ABC transporter substrate-binding protein [Cyanobacteria bacterium P01_E01_bin.42]